MRRLLVCFLRGKATPSWFDDESATRYLLAFLVVFSGLLTALEFTTTDDTANYDTTLEADDVADLEMIPVVEMDNPVTLVAPTPNNAATEIEVVDDVEQLDTLPPPPAEVTQLSEALTEAPVAEAPTTTEGVGEGQTSALTTIATDQPVSLRVVQQLPEFPGGQAAFIDWLTKRLRIPAAQRNAQHKHTVLASFVIETDGTVSNISIVESGTTPYDNEVTRVLKLMPKWKPGKMQAKPCRTLVHLPVQFRQ
ncbi:MAG: TonB family protein [Bacteroidaceae bacterium]|nr:TonB family protein [Bacteroidaceae bacterium]